MITRRHDPIADQLVRLGFAPVAAARLSHAGTLLDLPADTTLCTLGERGRQAFLLLSGTADVLTEHGVIPLGSGQIVGELATLDPQRTRNATVVTHGPVTVLVFDVATFRTLARETDLHDALVPARTAA